MTAVVPQSVTCRSVSCALGGRPPPGPNAQMMHVTTHNADVLCTEVGNWYPPQRVRHRRCPLQCRCSAQVCTGHNTWPPLQSTTLLRAGCNSGQPAETRTALQTTLGKPQVGAMLPASQHNTMQMRCAHARTSTAHCTASMQHSKLLIQLTQATWRPLVLAPEPSAPENSVQARTTTNPQRAVLYATCNCPVQSTHMGPPVTRHNMRCACRKYVKMSPQP